MSEWKTVRLGDMLKTSSGGTPSKKNNDYYHNGNIPWILSGDISQEHITKANNFITQLGLDNSSAKFFPKGTVLVAMYGATVGQVGILDIEATTNQAICGIFPDNHFSTNYLFYFCKSQKEHLLNLAIGGAQPNISQEIIKNLQIPLPPLETQEQIATQLDKCTTIIAKYKQMLEKYDMLIKSRFIEMFGNPQCISNNWKVNPLSDYCIVNPKKSELGPIPDDYELSFIPMQSVSENGDVDTSSIKHYKDVKIGFTYFRENDVLFAKITPCMENGKGGVARKLKNQIGFGSTEFHVLRPIETISNSEWIYRLTTFKTFRKDAENNMTGSAGQRRTPKEFFDKYKVGLPPIELQNDFAAFVQQIDKSKFAVQKSLEKAETLYKSLMQEYFG